MISLEGDFEDFGAVALAVAVLTAQVDVAEELHFDVLEAGAAAGGAAAIAAVEAEFGRGVAALAGQRGGGEKFANGIPGTDIADRVGACGFADGRLVDKDHIAQMICAEQTVMQARRFGGAPEMAHQGRRQNVLNQGGLA